MQGLLRCKFIMLFVLVIFFNLTSGKFHRNNRKHYHSSRHKHHEPAYKRIALDSDDDSFEYSKPKTSYHELNQYHNRRKYDLHRLKTYSLRRHFRPDKDNKYGVKEDGRGILSSLLFTPVNIVKSLVNLDPLGAVRNAVTGVVGTVSQVLSKFGEFASGIQTQLYNLGADEINDLVGAADQPISYQLFTPSNLIEPIIMNKTQTDGFSPMGKNKKLKVIIHGFSPQLNPLTEANTTVDLKGQLTIKNSYFASGYSDNIIVADWTSLARTFNYLSAAAGIRVVGADLAEFLHNLYKDGILKSFDDVHIIGFSLGSHVSGVTGRIVQELVEDAKIGRITGLDPAELSFGEFDGKVPHDSRFVLDKSDGKFVDIIHCNSGLIVPLQLGLRAESGHADFWPNGGAAQPGCDGLTELVTGCSHSRCWQLFSESIGSRKYESCKCANYDDFKNGKCGCDQQEKVYMGDLCPLTARGQYYLEANIDEIYNQTLVRSAPLEGNAPIVLL